MVRFSIFRALLFSPAFRVNNLRLLLLVSSFTSVWLTVVLYSESSQSLIAQTALPLEPRSFFISVIRLAICSCSLIFLHHILILFGWRVHRLAVIDLAIVVIETCVMCYLIYWFAMEDLPLFDPGIWSFSIHVLLLLFSAAFRTATVIACNDKLFNQRFAFLGGCTRTRPPFTPLTILLNRSLARPLVRGESKPIIFIRAVILTCIGVGIPLFGIYAVIIRPVGAQVSTQMILGVPGHPGHVFQAPPGNATIGLPGLSYAGSRDSAVVSATLWSDEVIACPATSGSRDDNFVQCPVSWPDIATMSISVHFTGGMLQVYPIQGTLPAGLEYWELYLLGGGIPLFPGSNVIAALSWTERQLISKTLWWGFGSRSTVFISEITGLQTNAFSATTDANVTTLVLFQTSANAMKVLQDTADVTAISGIATFGGFWTFVNGTFALFFGANVIYFAFGRRPLSALGVVHIFQRRALVRQWNEDFPAIHTEGGQPGSQSAGIVAFIRQRLVDLDEDPRTTPDEQEGDIEAQTQEPVSEPDTFEVHGAYRVQESGSERVAMDFQIARSHSEVDSLHRGYSLEEIPLLDMDLGLGEELKSKIHIV